MVADTMWVITRLEHLLMGCLLGGIAVAEVPRHQLVEWSVGAARDGSAVEMEALVGQAVVISYWGASSQGGAESLDILSAVQKSYRSRGMVVIAPEMLQLGKAEVEMIRAGRGNDLLIAKGARGPVTISNLPHSFVFDPKGDLLYSGSPQDFGFETAVKKSLLGSRVSSQPLLKKAPAKEESIEKTDLISERKWVNQEGKKMVAAVIEMRGEKVLFRMKDGRELPYAIKDLSDSDQTLIQEVANQ